jgi:hypothetical protein
LCGAANSPAHRDLFEVFLGRVTHESDEGKSDGCVRQLAEEWDKVQKRSQSLEDKTNSSNSGGPDEKIAKVEPVALMGDLPQHENFERDQEE